MVQLVTPEAKESLEARVLAARLGAHQKKTADKYYVLDGHDPETDAHIAKAYADVFIGPLPPLTPNQILAKQCRTTADILQDFRALAKRDLKRQKRDAEQEGGEQASPEEEGRLEEKEDDPKGPAADALEEGSSHKQQHSAATTAAAAGPSEECSQRFQNMMSLAQDWLAEFGSRTQGSK